MKSFLHCLLPLLTAGLLLGACASNNQQTTIPPLPTESAIPQKQSTPTTYDNIISPTTTATLLPVIQENTTISNAGLIIFSMADGEYKHLFAYHPSFLSVTRLTGDTWDDDSPAVSPDGNKIAFTSTRYGTREIFILDLVENTISQMTNSDAYEGSLTWSPDGQYIAYDAYQNGHYDLIVQSVSDPSEPLIQLTDGGSNNFQPSWSPDGSQLAFVSDRSGQNEIWLARLQTSGELFVSCFGDSQSDYSHPVWAPDGKYLAVSRHQTKDEVLILQPGNPDYSPVVLGNGKNPVWLPDGSGILVTLESPNQTEILAYAISDHHLILPPIPMAGSILSYDWKAANLSQNIQNYLTRNSIASPDVLWIDEYEPTSEENDRRSLVPLIDVSAPQPSLSDAVDDSFVELRNSVDSKIGWDFLGTLENATIASTTTSMPDISENWLYTGRAIALNMAPYEADWMVASREDFAGETYWRIWIKCKKQDGTCGQPLTIPVWDFSSRYSGDPVAYENGGVVSPAPSGYWLDFTELALRFGWERLPSLNNWRSYFPGIQFNIFVLRQGLTWHEALLDIYPPEQVELIIEKSQ